jgi:hypothetical protein
MWRCCRKRAFCKWHMTSLICMLSSPTRMIWFIDLYWSLKLGWFWGVRWECFDTFGCGETFLASLRGGLSCPRNESCFGSLTSMRKNLHGPQSKTPNTILCSGFCAGRARQGLPAEPNTLFIDWSLVMNIMCYLDLVLVHTCRCSDPASPIIGQWNPILPALCLHLKQGRCTPRGLCRDDDDEKIRNLAVEDNALRKDAMTGWNCCHFLISAFFYPWAFVASIFC